MHSRVWSSIAVVIVGLVPALSGGPVFALFLTLLCAAGYREYLGLAAHHAPPGARLSPGLGYVAVAAFALAAVWRLHLSLIHI